MFYALEKEFVQKYLMLFINISMYYTTFMWLLPVYLLFENHTMHCSIWTINCWMYIFLDGTLKGNDDELLVS